MEIECKVSHISPSVCTLIWKYEARWRQILWKRLVKFQFPFDDFTLWHRSFLQYSRIDYRQARLQKAFSKFQNFVFDVQGREFKVQVNNVVAASPYIMRMFRTDMKESHSSSIDAIEPEILKHLLQFTYEGKLSRFLKALLSQFMMPQSIIKSSRWRKFAKQNIPADLIVENAL